MADHELRGDKVSSEIVGVVASWLEASGSSEKYVARVRAIASDRDGISLNELRGTMAELRLSARQLLLGQKSEPSRYDFDDLRAKLDSELKKEFRSHIDVEPTVSRPAIEATEFLRVFFSNYVRYLGPLRDEPRPIYPLEALANPTDVGYRGEHTAAVLDLNRERRVSYVLKASFSTSGIALKRRTASLHDAIVEWLEYVGVAQEITTNDKGTFGHQLQVQTERANRFHDLTNVGVGVSQVLPIIVMSLLAPKSRVLILEQPELHLHPKVQARFADFFLAMSLDDKQCILETHSEYLVERLRLRIAQSDDDRLQKLINPYFTERKSGVTSCRPVRVSEYGAVIDWPDNFWPIAKGGQGHFRCGLAEACATQRCRCKVRALAFINSSLLAIPNFAGSEETAEIIVKLIRHRSSRSSKSGPPVTRDDDSVKDLASAGLYPIMPNLKDMLSFFGLDAVYSPHDV